MDGDPKEQLSALVDDELAPNQRALLLARLLREPQSRQQWAHYHLIGEAMRRALPPAVDPDFSERIARAIATEALPPSPPAAATDSTSSVQHQSARWLRPLVGLAVAASVAVVAILSLPSSPLHEPASSAPLAQRERSVQPVAVTLPVTPLDTYLRKHAEYAGRVGVAPMLPYVRMVSDER